MGDPVILPPGTLLFVCGSLMPVGVPPPPCVPLVAIVPKLKRTRLGDPGDGGRR